MGGLNDLPAPDAADFGVAVMVGRGFAVFDSAEIRVSVFFTTRAEANVARDRLQAEADRKAGRRLRRCLCCRAEFRSAGWGNRLCDRCCGADAGPVDLSFARPARRIAAAGA